jgi:hypothetical protein
MLILTFPYSRKLTDLGRYGSTQSDQSSYDGDVFTNSNINDTNNRPRSLYGVVQKPSRNHHDENNNKSPPPPPPLPPLTPTTPRSTMKSTGSENESYSRQTSQNYCKHLIRKI